MGRTAWTRIGGGVSPQTRLPRTCLSGVFLSVSGTKDGAGPEGDPFGGLPLAFDVDPGLAVVGVLVHPPSMRVLLRRTPSVEVRYLALIVASVALSAQLAAWHLIGWGST